VGTVAAAAVRGAALAKKARRHGRSPPRPRAGRRAAEEAVASAGGASLDGLSRDLRSALERFEAEVAQPDEEINLAYAASLLAQHADPSIDPEAEVLRPLAALGEAFRAQLAEGSSQGTGVAGLPEHIRLFRRASALCAFMEANGFEGCPRTDEGYYDANNSRMDKVIQGRRGIPITLSLAYMEVGRAAGLQLRPMNFPGHFLLRFGDAHHAGVVDAFTNRVLTEQEVTEFLSGLYGQPIALDPSWRTSPQLPKVIFLLRMVRNLQNVYNRDGNFSQAVQMLQYARCLEARAGIQRE